jgi:hypothetical protein
MAIKWPLANGVWSNAANWNDGTLPDVGDDVHADGKTVTIDQDVTVLSIRTTQRDGGTAGGGFNVSGTRILSCNILGGTTQCLSISNFSNITIIGDIISGTSTSVNGVNVGSNSSITITGNLNGRARTSAAVVVGGSFNYITITGNLIQTSGENTINREWYALRTSGSNNNVIITGTVRGTNTLSFGVYNTGLNYVEIIGIGLSDSCRNINLDATVILKRAVGSEIYGTGLRGFSNTLFVFLREIEYGPNGESPTSGQVKFVDDINVKTLVTTIDNTQVTLVDLNTLPNEIPIESDVREGTNYNAGQKIGTLVIPSSADVRRSIPVDNTVGTADLTAEGFLTEIENSSNPIAIRLKNVATVETVGDQLGAVYN